MAAPTKKGTKNTKARTPRAVAKTTLTKQDRTIAELRRQLAESLQREKAAAKELQEREAGLREAVEQQTATNEILRVIASSPTDIQPMLDVVAEMPPGCVEDTCCYMRLAPGPVLI